jgi:putative ABC transport system permease protein
MFFLTYLRRELRRRMRQAIFIALGLALGIGLVVTVIGASAGVKAAQAKVLTSLYGAGTDITVTTALPPPKGNQGRIGIQITPSGVHVCVNGKCHLDHSGVLDTLITQEYAPMGEPAVASVRRLHGVQAADGGLTLVDNRMTLPSSANPGFVPPTSFTVDGADIAQPHVGPFSNATLRSGRTFTAADENSDVALADSGYAASHGLKAGGTVTIANVKFTVVGIVSQPESSTPPDVYIPLARAQALAYDPANLRYLTNDVNTIYVTAASSADIAAIQKAIEKLLPSATVTSSANLANEVTGSLASTAKLANSLGKWLAVLVLIAAFALASLLTIAAVSRRTPEFGTLKALGWRSNRIVGQVLGESVVCGILGGLAGVGLGFAGVAIIDKIAPKLSATLPSASGGGLQTQTVGGPGGGTGIISTPAHTTVSVPMSASVTLTAILLAVLLAIAGGLLAGSFGGWRAARLRPVTALSKVG